MIDYKDLMLGNWVYESNYTKYPMQVVGIGENYCYLNFEGNEGDIIDGIDKYMMPIEVTEEVLNKIGFKEDTEQFIKSYYKGEVFEYRKVINKCFIKIQSGMSNSNDRDWYCHIDNNTHQTIGGFDFQYLHELQNGIRLITKSDLEIKEL